MLLTPLWKTGRSPGRESEVLGRRSVAWIRRGWRCLAGAPVYRRRQSTARPPVSPVAARHWPANQITPRFIADIRLLSVPLNCSSYTWPWQLKLYY